jgi:hypothetical protein
LNDSPEFQKTNDQFYCSTRCASAPPRIDRVESIGGVDYLLPDELRHERFAISPDLPDSSSPDLRQSEVARLAATDKYFTEHPNVDEVVIVSACTVCQKLGSDVQLYVCTKCKDQWYCGKDCQRIDYATHRLLCIAAEKKPTKNRRERRKKKTKREIKQEFELENATFIAKK